MLLTFLHTLNPSCYRVSVFGIRDFLLLGLGDYFLLTTDNHRIYKCHFDWSVAEWRNLAYFSIEKYAIHNVIDIPFTCACFPIYDDIGKRFLDYAIAPLGMTIQRFSEPEGNSLTLIPEGSAICN